MQKFLRNTLAFALAATFPACLDGSDTTVPSVGVSGGDADASDAQVAADVLSAPDTSPAADLAAEISSPPDGEADQAVETGADAEPDLAAPDAVADAAPEIAPPADAAADSADAAVTPPDTAADIGFDTPPAPDAVADAAPETSPVPDAAADQASDAPVQADAEPDVAPVLDSTADVAAEIKSEVSVGPDAAAETVAEVGQDAAADAVAQPCALNCNDGNPCTADTCLNAACVHTAIATCGAQPACAANSDCPAGKVCDPQSHACAVCVANSDCGAGAWCAQGQCIAAAGCKSDSECKAKNQVCDKGLSQCVDCLSNLDCAAGENCQVAQCVPFKACKSSKECPFVCDVAKGVCVACTSASDCKPTEFCSSGQCLPDVCGKDVCVGNKSAACKADGSGYEAPATCDDTNGCTNDACSGGVCAFSPNTVACDDGSACTANDACANGKCAAGAAVACDDKQVCTKDSCDPAKGCVFSPTTGGACDDNNACTDADACQAGKCMGNSKDCSDGNPCTADLCTAGNCQWTAQDGGACSDSNPCTDNDVCKGGKCTGVAISCFDANPCTDDACDKTKGCVFTANAATCDDGNGCTTSDACQNAKCTGTAKLCSDGNACTDDTCAGGNCVFTNNTATCGAAGTCSQCTGGSCVAGGSKGLDISVGAGNDLRTVLPVVGGGYTAVGATSSQTKGSSDGWFVKLNAAGVKTGEKLYGGAGEDVFFGHMATDGGYVIWGRQTVNNAGAAWLMKTDGDGNATWNNTYPGPAGSTGTASTAAYRAAAWQGGWGIAGATVPAGSFQNSGWVARIDGTGKQVWAASTDKVISFAAIGVFSDGGLVAGGVSASYQVVAIKYNVAGAIQWTYTGPSSTFVADGLVTADQFTLFGTFNNKGLGLSQVDIGGKAGFTKNFAVGTSYSGIRVGVGPNGGFLASGYYPGTTTDGFLISADAGGNQLWSKLYGGAGADMLYGITFANNRILVAGNSNSATGAQQGWILDLDSQGNLGCECAQNSDCNDNNACTNDTCNNGVCGHSNLAKGTNCGTNMACDGNGKCAAIVPVCGNGVCEPGETVITCFLDCALPTNHVCDKSCGNSVTMPNGGTCYCDAQCKVSGDCCNSNATAKTSSCGGSTCTACK